MYTRVCSRVAKNTDSDNNFTLKLDLDAKECTKMVTTSLFRTLKSTSKVQEKYLPIEHQSQLLKTSINYIQVS